MLNDSSRPNLAKWDLMPLGLPLHLGTRFNDGFSGLFQTNDGRA